LLCREPFRASIALSEQEKKMPKKKPPIPGVKTTATVAGIGSAETVEEAGFEAVMSPPECLIWRQGEFRQRVREAVADWANEPPASILPTNTLGELAKGTQWNIGQQANLVQAVNAHQVFAPPFPQTRMRALAQLFPPTTTVAMWEKIVWRNQNPLTTCFQVTD
jgi:hypothetical protein